MIVALLNQAIFAQQDFLLTLAQSPRLERATNNLRFYLTVLAITFIVIAVVAAVARKYLAGPVEPSQGEAIFDLSELRRLHREGQLSDDEYLAARAAALKDSRARLGDDAPQPDTDAAPARPRPAHPGIELGPELLDPPGNTPGTPAVSDNPDKAPPPDDNHTKD